MVRANLGLVSTLFCVGVIAGMIAVWPDGNNDPASTPDAGTASGNSGNTDLSGPASSRSLGGLLSQPGAEDQQLLASPGDPSALSVRDTMLDARRLMIAGGYDRAARMLRQAVEPVSLQRPGSAAPLMVWLGLAEEMSGRRGSAQLAYASALRGNPGDEGQAVALAGLARTWLAENRIDEALDLLVDLSLQSEDFSDRDGWLEKEILWLLAVAMRNRGIESGTNGAAVFPVFFLEPAANLEAMIDLLSPKEPRADPETVAVDGDAPAPAPADQPQANPAQAVVDELASELPVGVQVIQNPVNDLELVTLDVHLRSQSLTSLVQQIAAVADLTLSVTAEARQDLSGRSKSIVARGQNAAMLLDVLLAPVSLSWRQENGVLHVYSVSPDESHRHWREAASKLFRQFLIQQSGDSRLGFAQLNLGNLALLDDNVESAAEAWQAAFQTSPVGELLARILINQALLDRRLGRVENALVKLYRVVDITYDYDLKGAGWAQIAELNLELGRLDESISAASRTIRNRSDNSSIEKAVIAQAAAYLLRNNPWAANQSVFDARDALAASAHPGMARFLGSYSRYLGSQTEFARSREIPRLMQALAEINGQGELPAAVAWLAARAAADLGFDEIALAIVSRSLGNPNQDFWMGRLSWTLAMLHREKMEFDESRKILEHLATLPDLELARRAGLELSSQLLQQGQPAAALQRASQVLDANASDTEKRQALQIMGAAHSALDQHVAAALCYAGTIPEAWVPAISPDTQSGDQPQ